MSKEVNPIDLVDEAASEQVAKSPLGLNRGQASPMLTPHVAVAVQQAPLLGGQQLPPAIPLKKERPVHRIMLELAAKGYNNKEIAEAVGHTTASVSNALRQGHSQQTLVNEIQRVHGVVDEFVEIVNRNIVKSAKLYEDILDDPKASRAEKMEVAERFINRKFGKAAQPIVHAEVDLNDLSDEELAKMLPNQTTPGHKN